MQFWQNLTNILSGGTETEASTKALMKSLAALFEELTREFNAGVADEPLQLTVQVPSCDTTNGASKNARLGQTLVARIAIAV